MDSIDSDGMREHERAALIELENNGRQINWLYWVRDMPSLSAFEAARLVAGLDPDIFTSLKTNPGKNDTSKARAFAKDVQRLADRELMTEADPGGWLAWAMSRSIDIHTGFILAVEQFKKKRPVFSWSARAQMDLALLEMNPDDFIVVKSDNGVGSSSAGCPAKDYIAQLRERIARQSAGFYSVEEAAKLLADHCQDGDAKGWQHKMYHAWRSGDLPIRDPNKSKKINIDAERAYFDLVKYADIDMWLDKDGGGLSFPKSTPPHVNLDSLARELAQISAKREYGDSYANDSMSRDIGNTLHKIGFGETGLPGIRPHILKMVADGEIEVRAVRSNLPPVNLSDVTPENFDKWAVSPDHANNVRAILFPMDRAVPVGAAPDGTALVWTPERKEAARTRLNKLRGDGVKAFAAQTAKEFLVSPARLRKVLRTKKTEPGNCWPK